MTQNYEAPAVILTADVTELTQISGAPPGEGQVGLGAVGTIGFGL